MNAPSPCTPARGCSCSHSCQHTAKGIVLPVASRAYARLLSAPTIKPPQALLPQEAANRLEALLSKGTVISEVHISGPGDPLADIRSTLDTCSLVRNKHADLQLSLTTLGINGAPFADTLAKHGVTAVTLVVEAVDPEVVKNIYAWIRPGTRTVPLHQAAGILVDEQLRAVAALKRAGITVTIKTTVYPGINDSHVAAIAERMAELGAARMLLVPCSSSMNEPGPTITPDSATMAEMAEMASQYLATEVVEANTGDLGVVPADTGSAAATMLPQPSTARPNVAVVSASGMDIDLHLGQAGRALIYGPREDGLACLLDTRPLPEPGGGNSRWENLAEVLHDCFALLTSGAGDNPKKVLASRGLSVLVTDGDVEGTVDVLYGGGKKGKHGRNSRPS